MTDENGNLVEQYSYEPYGMVFAAEDGSGNTIDLGTTDGLGVLKTMHLHQGLMLDPKVNLYHNRARDYAPILGRFLQPDPNETALLVSATLAQNAKSPEVLVRLSAGGQYAEGSHLYGWPEGRPLFHTDPTGLGSEDVPPDKSHQVCCRAERELVAFGYNNWHTINPPLERTLTVALGKTKAQGCHALRKQDTDFPIHEKEWKVKHTGPCDNPCNGRPRVPLWI